MDAITTVKSSWNGAACRAVGAAWVRVELVRVIRSNSLYIQQLNQTLTVYIYWCAALDDAGA